MAGTDLVIKVNGAHCRAWRQLGMDDMLKRVSRNIWSRIPLASRRACQHDSQLDGQNTEEIFYALADKYG